jgi:hypothetical protein
VTEEATAEEVAKSLPYASQDYSMKSARRRVSRNPLFGGSLRREFSLLTLCENGFYDRDITTYKNNLQFENFRPIGLTHPRFERRLNEFVVDYVAKKYVAEKSGWGTLAQIADKSHIWRDSRTRRNSLYGCTKVRHSFFLKANNQIFA